MRGAVLIVVAILLIIWALSLGRRRKRRHPRRGKGISLLVPFKTDHAERERNWLWLLSYWKHELPGAEIVVSCNHETPFRKTRAVNEAFLQSHGDVIVILDADAYLDAESILRCAKMIRRNPRNWYVPYRRLYRLTKKTTEAVLASDPASPLKLTDPPPKRAWHDEGGHSSGHWYGALCQVMPRTAFASVGGMDERFHGWGGEDISFMRAVDTIHGRHKSLDAPAYHLWHPSVKAPVRGAKQWGGQARPVMNSVLTTRYLRAFGDRQRMQALLDERGRHA